MPRRTTKGPNPIDIHVGSRLRKQRMMLGMSQASLAEAFELTFQQVQKYESGMNRMGPAACNKRPAFSAFQCLTSLKAGIAALSSRLATYRRPMSTISLRVRTGFGSPRRSCEYRDPRHACAS